MQRILAAFLTITASCGPECMDWPDQVPPSLWTMPLIVRNDLNTSPKARAAFLVAAWRWRMVGMNFEVVTDPTPEEESTHFGGPKIVAFRGPEDFCQEWDMGGYADTDWIHVGQEYWYYGYAALCVEILERDYPDNFSAWVDIAQHELGHAIGFPHREDSLMGEAPNFCPLGFTKEDGQYMPAHLAWRATIPNTQ